MLLEKLAKKKIKGGLTFGEGAADFLAGPLAGSIVTTTKAKKGKRLKVFGNTMGYSLGGSIPGVVVRNPLLIIGGSMVGHHYAKKQLAKQNVLKHN